MTEGSEVLMTPAEAARLLGLAAQTLARWRVEGGGPPYLKLGGKSVRYLRSAVISWAAARERRSTTDENNTPPAGSGRAA